MGKLGGVALLIVLVFAFTGIVFVTGGGKNSCAVAATISPATVAGLEPVAGYSGDQLVNAAAIITAGAAAGVNVKGQTLGVMTSMGESGLRNIEYGDLAGPDSRGLFQQRHLGHSRAAPEPDRVGRLLLSTPGEGPELGDAHAHRSGSRRADQRGP